MAHSFNNPIKFVASGFPSPGDDFAKPSLDLNSYLIQHPSASFFMRVETNAYRSKEIYRGDILLIDRALYPKAGRLLLISSETEFKIMTYEEAKTRVRDFWGVVTCIIRKL